MSLPNEVQNLLMGGSNDFEIERSLRYNSADSVTLKRTWAATGNRTKFTWSMWFKRVAEPGAQHTLLQAGGVDHLAYESITIPTTDQIDFVSGNGSDVVNYRLTTNQVFRDVGAWYHFVFVWDTANATANDRMRMYINGVAITSFATRTNPGLNASTGWMNVTGQGHAIGNFSVASAVMNGYIAEVHFVNAQALDATYFGEFDATTGFWKPKLVENMTYGTTGFYLSFADNTSTTTLGQDDAGGEAGSGAGSNDWTLTNFSVAAGTGNDSLTDSPTNNFCTLNPLDKPTAGAWTQGGLRFASAAGFASRGTFAMPSGKWYWETVKTAGTNPSHAIYGIQTPDGSLGGYGGVISNPSGYGYFGNTGNKYNNSSGTAYGSTFTTNDVIGCAFDADNGKIFFSKNGVWQNSGDPAAGTGAAYTGIVSDHWQPYVSNQTTANADHVDEINFGQRPFTYTQPDGFKTLCGDNLPFPPIAVPSQQFEAKTYTGTGASLTNGVTFEPDFIWIKGRSGATSHALYDSTRGVQKNIATDSTVDEATSDAGLTSFYTAGGFVVNTLAKVNTNTATYVGWCWKKGTTPGFDIVSYTGTGANRTIAHSLGAIPDIMIVKARTTASTDQPTSVYSSTLAATEYLVLDTTAAKATGATYWNSTAPTSSVFSLGTNAAVNTTSDTYIAYLFTEIKGFSRIDTFTGNALADGPFVYCGFRPRWVMIKCTSTTGSWYIWDRARDTINPADGEILGDTAAAEGTTADLDFVSNGFKIRAATAGYNASAATFLFIAFAEVPFKYGLAV